MERFSKTFNRQKYYAFNCETFNLYVLENNETLICTSHIICKCYIVSIPLNLKFNLLTFILNFLRIVAKIKVAKNSIGCLC